MTAARRARIGPCLGSGWTIEVQGNPVASTPGDADLVRGEAPILICGRVTSEGTDVRCGV